MVSRETNEKLKVYISSLEKWSKTINLVSRATLSHIWDRHISDSAQLFPFVLNDASFVNIGSSAGFPGLVLSILGLSNVHLVESDSKKTVFLQEVIRLTGASALVHHCRVEELYNQKFDIIIPRAFSSLECLLSKTSHLQKNTSKIICLKGVSFKKELDSCIKKWHFD